MGEHEAALPAAAVADHAALVDGHPGHPLRQPGVGQRLAPAEDYWSPQLSQLFPHLAGVRQRGPAEDLLLAGSLEPPLVGARGLAVQQHEQPQVGQAVLGGQQGAQLGGVLHHQDPRLALHTRPGSLLQAQPRADADRDASAVDGE